MISFPLLELLIGIFCGLIVAMIILLLLQVRSSRQINRLTYPAYEYVIKQTEREADEIIKKAQAEARAITTAAEKEARAQVANHAKEVHEAHEAYFADLKEYYTKATSALDEIQKAGQATLHTMTDEIAGVAKVQEAALQAASDGAAATWKKIAADMTATTETQAAQITTDLQALSQELKASVAHASETHTQAIAEQFAASMKRVEEELVAYQQARQAIIDEHIEQLVESVATEVLHHSLTSTDHAALARAALADARAKHII